MKLANPRLRILAHPGLLLHSACSILEEIPKETVGGGRNSLAVQYFKNLCQRSFGVYFKVSHLKAELPPNFPINLFVNIGWLRVGLPFDLLPGNKSCRGPVAECFRW